MLYPVNELHLIPLTEEEVPGGVGGHVDGVGGVGVRAVHAGPLGDEAEAARRPRHPVLPKVHHRQEAERGG